MLPKIAVVGRRSRDFYLDKSGLLSDKVLHYEGGEAKIDDFRSWLFTSVNIAQSDKETSIVVWDADLLSGECQAVLLKPLEEVPDHIKFVLFVRNENGVLPTISSRCTIELLNQDEGSSVGWKKILDCVNSGPGDCVIFPDNVEIEEAREMVESLIVKLKETLEMSLSEKRLQVIDECFVCLDDLKRKNVNYKLAFSDFLLRVWKLTKS